MTKQTNESNNKHSLVELYTRTIVSDDNDDAVGDNVTCFCSIVVELILCVLYFKKKFLNQF